MKTLIWSAFAFGVVLLTAMSSGCAVTGGYGYDAEYYQGAGYNYGGWGPHYAVAPVRVEVREDDHGHGRDRPVPSIPSNSHSRDSHEH
jgi:hypothetical protein